MDRFLRLCTDNLLISVTLCWLAGGSLAAVWPLPRPLPGPATIGLPVVFVLGLWAFFLSPGRRPLTALPLFFLIGLLHTQAALEPELAPGDIATVITAKTRATVIGRILTLVEYDGEKTRFELATEALLIHRPGAVMQPVRGTVQMTIPADLSSRFAPGMLILTMATVDRIRDYQTPGALPYRLQMAAKSIRCSGWVGSAAEILAVTEPPPTLIQTLRFLPEQVRQRVSLELSCRFVPAIAGIYQALLIGSERKVSPQLLEAFKDNGCMHVLSISGLHLSLLGLFAVTILTFLLGRSQWLLLRCHVPTLALVLTAPLLVFYTFIAGMNVPALRSLVTALLVLLAVVLRRQRSLIHLIAAAALLILALSPLALFTASFQLSFAAVVAINTIYPRLPLVIVRPEAQAEPSLITRILWTLQSMFYVSLAATVGTLPFMLYHFNRFSLIGPVMNLLIEPLLCLWALPCGLLAIPLLWIGPALATPVFQFGSGGIRLTLWLAEALAGFPYASLWTITPSWAEIVLFLVILLVLLHRRPTGRILALAGFLTAVLLGSFTFSLWGPRAGKEAIVSFLDVGQGTATLLQLPGGRTVLIDGGGSQSPRFNPGPGIIAPYLWRQRIWRLDDLVVTHPHQDHYNGLDFVAAHFGPQRLIANGEPGDEPAYRHLLATVRGRQTPILVAQAGDILHQGQGWALTCLGTNGLEGAMPSRSTNERSLVLRLQMSERSFLFPADIGVESEKQLLQGGGELAADVLLAPHHGSLTSSSQAFIAAVSPALIVVSASRGLQDSFPAPAHLRRWQERGIPVLVTARQGTITCRTDGRQLQVRTFTGEGSFLASRGRRGGGAEGGLNSPGL